MGAIDSFKYKIIKNFLDEKELEILFPYCKDRHYNNLTNFDMLQNNNGNTFFYKDPLIQTFLTRNKKLIEEQTSLELLETYSFWRCYTYGAELKKHKDRPSCEISATVFVASDKDKWPIFMGGTEVNLNPGDAVIYKGCDIEHWRETFEGDYHIQFFLHYVDKYGKYKDYKGDNIYENIPRG